MKTSQLANIHKALSNENRLEIFLSILKAQEASFEAPCYCPISQLMEKLCIGAPTISHHLKELVNAGLIETRKEGKFVVATINQTMMQEIADEYGGYFKFMLEKKERI